MYEIILYLLRRFLLWHTLLQMLAFLVVHVKVSARQALSAQGTAFMLLMLTLASTAVHAQVHARQVLSRKADLDQNGLKKEDVPLVHPLFIYCAGFKLNEGSPWHSAG
jgi:hypothetical protein